MKVALNALCITNRSGTGRYTYGLVDGFVRGRCGDLQLNVFLPAGFTLPRHWWDCASIRFYSIPVDNAIERIIWEQTALPQMLQKLGIAILHSPAFICPCLLPDDIQHIITVHDLAFLSYPQTIPTLRRMYLKTWIERSMQTAAAVITDSQTVADEVKQAYPSIQNIRTVHLGVDEFRYHPTIQDSDERILQSHNINKPYYLFVGTIEPRKNIETVLQAYRQAKAEGCKQQFVVVGRFGWMIDKDLLQQDGVVWLGHVDEADLPALYRHADALVAPSLYEGFDLPTVETAACGVSVIASDIAVHREVMGKDAVFVETTNADAWAQALLRYERGEQTRNVRRWVDVANDTVELYQWIKTKKG